MHRKEKDIDLTKPGSYSIGVFFMTKENEKQTQEEFERIAMGYNLKVVYWRTVPVDSNSIGVNARKSEPLIKQVNEFID